MARLTVRVGLILGLVLALWLASGGWLSAQTTAVRPVPRTATVALTPDPPKSLPGATIFAPPRGPFRVPAPGVEVTIQPELAEDDTNSRHDVVEILKSVPGLSWTPNSAPTSRTLQGKSTETVFRRHVWYLEFTFKPVRMMWIDVPQPSGKMQRKLIWYLVYHVKNTGQHLRPTQQRDGTYKGGLVSSGEIRFLPQFVLESPEFSKAYLDRVIPAAVGPIQQKEDPHRPLLNSVQISATPIPVSTDQVDRSVWGVVMWEDVDPRIDYFTVSVQGLTNAQKWIDPPGVYKAGQAPGTGRVLLHKTLKLNFWRPGDEILEDQRLIRFGIPGKVDYEWVYQ